MWFKTVPAVCFDSGQLWGIQVLSSGSHDPPEFTLCLCLLRFLRTRRSTWVFCWWLWSLMYLSFLHPGVSDGFLSACEVFSIFIMRTWGTDSCPMRDQHKSAVQTPTSPLKATRSKTTADTCLTITKTRVWTLHVCLNWRRTGPILQAVRFRVLYIQIIDFKRLLSQYRRNVWLKCLKIYYFHQEGL